MVEKVITTSENVLDFARYQAGRNVAGRMPAMSGRLCRYCRATLSEGERDEECSSAFNVNAAKAGAILARICRHCGAALSEGEREDECSSVLNIEAASPRGGARKLRAD